MIRAGLDPDKVLYQTADIAEQRDLSRWLPLAFSSLYCLVSAYGSKSPPKMADVMRMWGLKADADRLDALLKTGKRASTDRALQSFFDPVPPKPADSGKSK